MSKILATILFGSLVFAVTSCHIVGFRDDEKTRAATPAATTQKNEIKPLNGTAPYGIEKRPKPAGLNLDELLPKQVGPYKRTLLEKSEQRGVTPSSIEVDGDSVYATYRAGAKEIFVEFAIAGSAENAQAVLKTAAGETGRAGFPTDPRVGSIGTEPSYLKRIHEAGPFYAWTRGNYYFSASATNDADLDAFMKSFPY